jgi:serine/threonine-protein kinase HipA
VAPSLAPLYDLVSTAAYPLLTMRLAMSIDGARRLEDVDPAAWRTLADDVGFSSRYIPQRMLPFVADVVRAAEVLAGRSEHDAPVVATIVEGIRTRAARLLGE